MALRKEVSLEEMQSRGKGYFPDYVGLTVTGFGEGLMQLQFTIAPHHLAPNGFLHAGSIITLADTACGYGCIAHLPEGAQNFTTIELKSNHLSTAREGTICAEAKAIHLGRTTQVWDATVTHKESGKTLALFRCTQMILWPKG